MKDNFGIEIELGDYVAYTDTARNCPPLVCVVLGYTRTMLRMKTLYMWHRDRPITRVTDMNARPHKVIKLNQEQFENLRLMMLQTRIGYAEGFSNIEETENNFNVAFDEIVAYSEKIKNG